MSDMFDGCLSLVSIPDINDWKTSNNRTIFNSCISLLYIPNLYK